MLSAVQQPVPGRFPCRQACFLCLVSIFLVSLSNPVCAGLRCEKNYFGETICTTAEGEKWKGSTGFSGEETWRNEAGHTFRGRKDYFGDTTYRDESGHSLRRTTDFFGNPVIEDRDSGRQMRCRTGYTGDTVCD